MTTARRTRRSFLRAVGAAAACLPFYRLLESSVVRAAGEELPLKFVALYHPHGIAAELWKMRDSDTETEFDLSYENCSLSPFDDAVTYGRSFKDKILVIEGVDHLSDANGHDSAGTILTGSRIDGAKRPANSSIDQFLAVERGLGQDTRLSSLVLGVGTDSLESGACLSFGEGGAPLPKIIDPSVTFQTIFGGFVPAGDAAAAAAAEHRRRMDQSVIDFVRADIQRLKPRLAATEQQKLDQHLTSVREIEKRVAGIGQGATCAVPAAPDAGEYPQVRQYNGGEPYFDAITDLQLDMMAQALACDVTRFATLFMNDLSYAGNPLGLPADNHQAMAHTYDAWQEPHFGEGKPGNPSTWLPLAQFNRYSYGKMARLLQRLHEFGSLESTLVYAASDMGNPAAHSLRNVPTVLAGGANGKLRMGRRVKLAADCPPDRYHCGETWTRSPNNRILVTVAQAFGAPVEAYGTQNDPTLTKGALSELTA